MNLIGQLQDITTLRDWSPLKILLRGPLGLAMTIEIGLQYYKINDDTINNLFMEFHTFT